MLQCAHHLYIIYPPSIANLDIQPRSLYYDHVELNYYFNTYTTTCVCTYYGGCIMVNQCVNTQLVANILRHMHIYYTKICLYRAILGTDFIQ